jgi:DNA-binding LacI/PurR family transcriptional regulator
MADAGIVCTGSRRGVLEWFARQPLPTFALFRLTPPTALIVDETAWIIAAMNHLLRLGLRVPDDVSLVSTDDHPTLQCCHPPVARIARDRGPVIRRILK